MAEKEYQFTLESRGHMAGSNWVTHEHWIRLTCQKENVYHGSPAWPFGAFPLAKTPHHFDLRAVMMR